MRFIVLVKGKDDHVKVFAPDFKRLHVFVHAAHERLRRLRKGRIAKAAQHFFLRAAGFHAGRPALIAAHNLVRNRREVLARLLARLADLLREDRGQGASVVNVNRRTGNDIHMISPYVYSRISSIYAAVPAAMLSNVLRLKRCTSTTTAPAASCFTPSENAPNGTLFKQ